MLFVLTFPSKEYKRAKDQCRTLFIINKVIQGEENDTELSMGLAG